VLRERVAEGAIQGIGFAHAVNDGLGLLAGKLERREQLLGRNRARRAAVRTRISLVLEFGS
jgi:hypothetical protein